MSNIIYLVIMTAAGAAAAWWLWEMSKKLDSAGWPRLSSWAASASFGAGLATVFPLIFVFFAGHALPPAEWILFWLGGTGLARVGVNVLNRHPV
jgi:hypothetical protein